MKYTNNFYEMSIAYFVENDMAAYGKSSITSANVVADFTKCIILRQSVKGLIKFSQILVSLFPTPGLLREFCNPFQVSLGRSLYSEASH